MVPRAGFPLQLCRRCRCRASPQAELLRVPDPAARRRTPHASRSSTGPSRRGRGLRRLRLGAGLPRRAQAPAAAGGPRGNAMPGIGQQGRRPGRRPGRGELPRHDLPRAVCIGLPIRRLDLTLDRGGRREPRRAASSACDDDLRPSWSPGGSQGARRLNPPSPGAAEALAAAGVQVLHVVGPKGEATPVASSGVPYKVLRLRRPDGPRATPPPTLVLCRSGSNTVTEVSGGRAAGRLRPAADRQRRAGAQRAPGGGRRGRPAGGRRRADPRVGRGEHPRPAGRRRPPRRAWVRPPRRSMPARRRRALARIILEAAR